MEGNETDNDVEEDDIEEEENDEDEDDENEDDEEEEDNEKDHVESDDGSDSDEAPEGISLKESKQKAQEKAQKISEVNKSAKLHKKQMIKDRQLKNEKQREHKKKLPEKTKEKELAVDHDDDIIGDTDDESIDAILNQMKEKKSVIKTQPEKNQKITFPEEDEDFDFEDDAMDTDPHSIKAQHLYSVNKMKDIGDDARQFYQEHFFGARITREISAKAKYSKKNLKRINRESKVNEKPKPKTVFWKQKLDAKRDRLKSELKFLRAQKL